MPDSAKVEANIAGTPGTVKQSPLSTLMSGGWAWTFLLAAAALLKIALAGGIELGKDEAAYWHWSQHLDASYALLPLSAVRVAHLLYPDSELAVRLPFVIAGIISTLLIYRLCRLYRLEQARCLWAAAAFSTSHWIWHTTSFIHPDGFLVLTWLLAIVLAKTHLERPSAAHCFAAGAAAGLASLSKYPGVLLALSLLLWLALTSPRPSRRRDLLMFAVPFVLVISPLIYANLATGFDVPVALRSLSQVAAGSSLAERMLLFVASPLLFVSPLLLWLLYKGLCRLLLTMRQLPRFVLASGSHLRPDVLLALIPAVCVLAWFGLFALWRGQIKGNWILPAFLGLWPCVFGWRHLTEKSNRSARMSGWFLAFVLSLGALQTGVIGLSLKYPSALGRLVDSVGDGVDTTYTGLVSQRDGLREPSRSWTERVCEYSGWRNFSASLDSVLERTGVLASTPLVSSQYDLSFGVSFYSPISRNIYTIDDPKFRHLADFKYLNAASLPREIIFAARAGTDVPAFLVREYPVARPLFSPSRSASGCGPVAYDLVVMSR